MNLLTLLLLVVAQDTPKTEIPAYPPPAEVRASFLKMLDRPRIPLDAKQEDRPVEAGETTYSIATERRADGGIERVPVLISKPANLKTPAPAVIVLHGTGGNGTGVRDWLKALNARGIIGVAIDGRFHGYRSGGKGLEGYHSAITRAWKAKPEAPRTYPFYFDTCWDVWRTIDFLQTQKDIDPNRIGLMGISKGGIETWLAGSVDERVKVAAPCISVQSFRWSLEHDLWQGRANTIAPPHKAAAADRGEPEVTKETCRALWNKVIPGILDQYDCPSMLRLFAGRPLIIIGGDEDINCPVGGAKVAIASAENAFKTAGASDKLKVDIARGSGHAITGKQKTMILDWFAKLL